MLLPPTPLRLQSSFVWKYRLGGLVLLAVGISAGAGYAAWQYNTIRELLDQARIWRMGEPALEVRVSGREKTSKGIFHGYELDVEYVDAREGRHKRTMKFDTLGGEVDQNAEPAVHYLKDDPDQYALSWAMDVTTSRWCSIGFMMLAGVGLIGGSFSFLGWRALRRLLDAQRCAARSDEVIVEITKVRPQKVHGKITANEIFFTGLTPDGREVKGDTTFPIKFEPLWADASQRRMVALVPPENLKRAVVPRGDFWPFEFTADEQAKVRAAIAARGQGPV
jgi:hypothetical protein